MSRRVAAPRNRYADLLRVVAIGAVVLGHWLATSITYDDGRLGGQDVLGRLPWTRWLSLALQVMPLFFLVGGLANAASWTSHRACRASWDRWLYGRSVRLLAPTSVYVLVSAAVVAGCRAAQVDGRVLDRAGWAVALHLWFLPVYLGLLAATPVLHAAHRRWGYRVPVVLGLAAAGANIAFLRFHPPLLAWIDYLLVWGVVYQLGFAWHDRTLTRTPRRPLALAGAGAIALSGLIWLGPFPVSMVGVPGAQIKNSSPPSVALLAYAVAQVGLVLAAEPAVTRRLRGPFPRRMLARGNRTVMTLYLWHMAPVVLAALALYPTGLLPPAPIGSGTWLWQRLVWVTALAVLFVPLALALRPAERIMATRRRTDARTDAGTDARTDAGIGGTADDRAGAVPPHRRAWPLLVPGIGVTGVALARISAEGFAPDGRPPAAVLAAYAAGLLLLAAAGRSYSRRAEPRRARHHHDE